jgi:hypothetical protein
MPFQAVKIISAQLNAVGAAEAPKAASQIGSDHDTDTPHQTCHSYRDLHQRTQSTLLTNRVEIGYFCGDDTSTVLSDNKYTSNTIN